jgi:hypothetical protein
MAVCLRLVLLSSRCCICVKHCTKGLCASLVGRGCVVGMSGVSNTTHTMMVLVSSSPPPACRTAVELY